MVKANFEGTTNNQFLINNLIIKSNGLTDKRELVLPDRNTDIEVDLSCKLDKSGGTINGDLDIQGIFTINGEVPSFSSSTSGSVSNIGEQIYDYGDFIPPVRSSIPTTDTYVMCYGGLQTLYLRGDFPEGHIIQIIALNGDLTIKSHDESYSTIEGESNAETYCNDNGVIAFTNQGGNWLKIYSSFSETDNIQINDSIFINANDNFSIETHTTQGITYVRASFGTQNVYLSGDFQDGHIVYVNNESGGQIMLHNSGNNYLYDYDGVSINSIAFNTGTTVGFINSGGNWYQVLGKQERTMQNILNLQPQKPPPTENAQRGDIYFDDDDNVPKFFDGSEWKAFYESPI